MKKSLKIEVTADVVCPWCYLGWRRLKKALEMKPVEAEIVWKAYQLNPGMPAAGADYKEYMAKKFPPERMRQAQARLKELGSEEGVAFNFENITRAPNTGPAHRLIHWAAQEGKLDAVVEGVMKAYFTDGKFIGDEKTLADIGATAGMDRAAILKKFSEGVDIDTIKAEDTASKDSGISGVPFYRIGDEITVEGSQPAEDLVQEIAAAVK